MTAESHTRIVTFGEIMGRLSPPGTLRLRQAVPGTLAFSFGGAEANVAVSIAQLGGASSFVTVLPRNDLARSCVAVLRSLGVDASHIIYRDDGRLGLYFVEKGANQRPSRVIYDRGNSAVSLTEPDAFPWSEILGGAGWLHLTGITPSLSQAAAASTLAAARAAKAQNIMVSCDLNYRKKLWRWEPGTPPRELAERTMRSLLRSVDLVVGNEEDAASVLSIDAEDTDVEAGRLSAERYPQVASQICRQFENVSKVAITLRESISASHNNWGAMLYDRATQRSDFAPSQDGVYRPYRIKNIVDRVGTGDAFAAGLIFALTTIDIEESGAALEFAVAASCLAHSTEGDFSMATREEVEALLGGSVSGRVVR